MATPLQLGGCDKNKSERISDTDRKRVIRAEHHDAYPVIAIHYKNGQQGDLGPSVGATIAGLVERRTIRDFIDYLGKRKVDWRAKTDELMRAGDKRR